MSLQPASKAVKHLIGEAGSYNVLTGCEVDGDVDGFGPQELAGFRGTRCNVHTLDGPAHRTCTATYDENRDSVYNTMQYSTRQ